MFKVGDYVKILNKYDSIFGIIINSKYCNEDSCLVQYLNKAPNTFIGLHQVHPFEQLKKISQEEYEAICVLEA